MAIVSVMAEIQDLPRLVNELGTMAKEYMLQETVGAAKKLGWFSGFSLGAGLAWAAGIMFVGVAAMRAIVQLFPENPYGEALGYAVASLAMALVALVLVRLVPKEEIGSPTEESPFSAQVETPVRPREGSDA